MLKKGGFKPALLLNLMEAVRQCNVETLERGAEVWNRRAPQSASQPLVTTVGSPKQIVCTKKNFSWPYATMGCLWRDYATPLLQLACTICRLSTPFRKYTPP